MKNHINSFWKIDENKRESWKASNIKLSGIFLYRQKFPIELIVNIYWEKGKRSGQEWFLIQMEGGVWQVKRSSL